MALLTIPVAWTGATGVSGASTIEATYATLGPWAVSTGSATAGAETYSLFYPTDLGAGGFKHPILTWGNGTGATPSQYADTLDHLASWGFVVIASDSGSVGLGTEMLDGAEYMVAENADPASVFYQKLDPAKVGALGHSQGAGGTLNATVHSNGLIVSALTIELPDPIWWGSPVPSLASVAAPMFFIRGTSDPIATESAAQNWYDEVPAGVKAALIGAGHNDIQTTNNRLKGYITAWMMYTLQGDPVAQDAFVGSAAEINGNVSWESQAEKNLLGPVAVGGFAAAPAVAEAGTSGDHTARYVALGWAVLAAALATGGAYGVWRTRRR